MIFFIELSEDWEKWPCKALGSCCHTVCFLSVSCSQRAHGSFQIASHLIATSHRPESCPCIICHRDHSYDFQNCPFLFFFSILSFLLTIVCVVSNTGTSDSITEISVKFMSHSDDCCKYFSGNTPNFILLSVRLIMAGARLYFSCFSQISCTFLS